MLKRLAVVAVILAAFAALSSPAESYERTEIRSRTVTAQPGGGYVCSPDTKLIEVIGPETDPPEAEDFLFIQEGIDEFCVLSDYETAVEVTVYYLARKW
jgi:hypothetical protein